MRKICLPPPPPTRPWPPSSLVLALLPPFDTRFKLLVCSNRKCIFFLLILFCGCLLSYGMAKYMYGQFGKIRVANFILSLTFWLVCVHYRLQQDARNSCFSDTCTLACTCYLPQRSIFVALGMLATVPQAEFTLPQLRSGFFAPLGNIRFTLAIEQRIISLPQQVRHSSGSDQCDTKWPVPVSHILSSSISVSCQHKRNNHGTYLKCIIALIIIVFSSILQSLFFTTLSAIRMQHLCLSPQHLMRSTYTALVALAEIIEYYVFRYSLIQ